LHGCAHVWAHRLAGPAESGVEPAATTLQTAEAMEATARREQAEGSDSGNAGHVQGLPGSTAAVDAGVAGGAAAGDGDARAGPVFAVQLS
jgi:hypothetical protein